MEMEMENGGLMRVVDERKWHLQGGWGGGQNLV